MRFSTRILTFCIVFFVLSPLFGNHLFPQPVAAPSVIEAMEFREVDIKDVLRQLAKQYNLNIVFSEKVSGLITVQLHNVKLDEALESIITVNGFVYARKGNVIKVTTSDEAEREGKVTRLFKLNNADALKLKDALAKMLTSDGTIEADTRSNALLVTDSAMVLNKIEGLIPSLDEITPQVLIEAKIIETTLTKNEKLGIDWNTTIQAAGSKRPTTFPFSALSSDKNMYPQAKYSSETDATTGLTTITSDFPLVGDVAQSVATGAFPMVGADAFSFGTLDFTSFKAVLDFLKSRTNTKLVANPRIVTLNNQKARMNVGKVLSLPSYERNETTGQMEITGWSKENVGVSLEALPQITPDGHIKLKLKPEVSSHVGYASERNGVKEGPILTTRTAETEVMIRDGQTVVIGGLVKEDVLNTVKKIPVLGDIPVIGLLFTRKEVSTTAIPTEKTDLLIFVTARILKDSDEPLIGKDSTILTDQPRPFKLQAR